MLRTRVECLSLRYGCHDGEWTLPDEHRPVVVAGPNGSGKTTFVDGLVRTLFGFDRRRPDDVAVLEARRPWEHEGMRGRVILVRNGDRLEVRRDFDTAAVRVLAPDEGVDHFRGDGNPAARNQEARRYRQILTDLLGLSELSAYRQTLLIEQGELLDTTLGEHLLQVAAGGHARVEAARRQIAHAHRAVTRRPLHPTAAAAINPRELEKVDEELDAARARLDAAREAAELRGPLALDRDRTADRLAALDLEIQTLEEALSALARTDAADLGVRSLRDRVRRFEQVAEELRTAAGAVDEAEADLRRSLDGGAYPEDFPERLGRAETRWDDLESLRRTPAPALAGVALVLLVAAIGLLLAEHSTTGAITGTLGGLAGTGWLALWIGARRRRAAAKEEVARALQGVPAGGELGPATRKRALDRYHAQNEARARVAAARTELADAVRHARSSLREAADPPDPSGQPPDRSGAEGVLEALERAVEAGRERLARARTELDRIGDLSLRLPRDVAPTGEGVREALRERRSERARVQEALQDADQELLERGTAAESEEALEHRIASLEPRRAALARKADVLEAAHALLTDAYDAFRDRDQERLAQRISFHVAALGAGRLDGIEVDDALEEARVRTRGRAVAMASPPLSFGELHALQLGVRMGAADFLAGIGVLPPLIIDEPFAHLDLERAAALWGLLQEVASTRQVLVTTQDARLLKGLQIEPDLRFS